MTKLYTRLPRKKHIRKDGWLVELVSKTYDDEPFNCIHSYIVNVGPGCVRAGHFHEKKKEWFCIANGKLKLTLEDKETKESESIVVDSEDKNYDICSVEPGIAHIFKNISEIEKATLIVFSENPEDPDDTIKYKFQK